ncbi:hypothetical protein QUB60_19615 [Microcoleus sp. A2-C5]
MSVVSCQLSVVLGNWELGIGNNVFVGRCSKPAPERDCAAMMKEVNENLHLEP